MPKSSSWWQKLLGSSASASQRRERLEPGSADHDHAPLARDDWSNVPEAPESLRDLKWADSPLRAKPRSAPAPSPAPAHIPHAVPTPPELAPPVSGDPSLGLRKRRVHTDQPQSELLSAELEEAPEAVAALVPSGAELALPTDVVSLDSDGPLIDLASYPDDEPAAEPAAETPARDPRLDLALYEAARAGRVEEALALLEQGADPHAGPAESSRDRRHLPLIAAVLPDLRLLRALIARGLSVNETSNGVTPLLAACKDSWHGRPDAVMTLIANGSDVRQTDPDGNTPLHHAARSSDPGVAAMLLDAGASLDALNHAGQSPLGTAMESGNFRLARFLLDKGAGIQLNGGRSPLFDAAAIDDDDIGGVQCSIRHPGEAREAIGADLPRDDHCPGGLRHRRHARRHAVGDRVEFDLTKPIARRLRIKRRARPGSAARWRRRGRRPWRGRAGRLPAPRLGAPGPADRREYRGRRSWRVGSIRWRAAC